MKSDWLKFACGWLGVGAFFYLVDCGVVTLVDKASLDQPWHERGIHASGRLG
jgi:hypothetical protein